MSSSLHVSLFILATHLPIAVTPKGLTPETPESRASRLDTLALAIDDVTKTPEEAAAVLETMYGESKLDAIIHAGGKHPVWTQDHGRARCLSQLHKSGQVPEWATLAGIDFDATKRCAAATIRVLRSSAWKCHTNISTAAASDMARVFAEYAVGSGNCRPTKQSAERAGAWDRMRRQLWNSPKSDPLTPAQ
jgi:hypothetical protein